MAAEIRVGTCSFADEALTSLWYPRGTRSGEDRLRYYAERFDTVEIDATYYTLPTEDATPAGPSARRRDSCSTSRRSA